MERGVEHVRETENKTIRRLDSAMSLDSCKGHQRKNTKLETAGKDASILFSN